MSAQISLIYSISLKSQFIQLFCTFKSITLSFIILYEIFFSTDASKNYSSFPSELVQNIFLC